MIEHLSSILEN
jgi:hypothetical protein